jgi:hypothetical protein
LGSLQIKITNYDKALATDPHFVLALNNFEVAQDHAAGVFSGTDEVIEKITGHKPMGLEEFITKHRSAFE